MALEITSSCVDSLYIHNSRGSRDAFCDMDRNLVRMHNNVRPHTANINTECEMACDESRPQSSSSYQTLVEYTK